MDKLFQKIEDFNVKQFQGFVKGHSSLMMEVKERLIRIEELGKYTKEQFDYHLENEMEELKRITGRLTEIENWKLKVSTTAGVIGTILGFVLSKLNL